MVVVSPVIDHEEHRILVGVEDRSLGEGGSIKTLKLNR